MNLTGLYRCRLASSWRLILHQSHSKPRSTSACIKSEALQQELSLATGTSFCAWSRFGRLISGGTEYLWMVVQGFDMGGQGYGAPGPMGGPMGGGMGGASGFHQYQPPALGPGAPGYQSGMRQHNMTGRHFLQRLGNGHVLNVLKLLRRNGCAVFWYQGSMNHFTS